MEKQEQYPQKSQSFEDRMWYRLAKVGYILSYLPLPVLLLMIYVETSSTWIYSGPGLYAGYYTYHPMYAIGPVIVALLAYLVGLRLLKLAFLCIFTGAKPEWNKEYKKLF